MSSISVKRNYRKVMHHERKKRSVDSNIGDGESVGNQVHARNEVLVKLSELTEVLGLVEPSRSIGELLLGKGEPFLDLEANSTTFHIS